MLNASRKPISMQSCPRELRWVRQQCVWAQTGAGRCVGRPTAGEQKVPADVGAQSPKQWMRWQKGLDKRHACNVARASEDASDCSVTACYQVQMAAAPKQAVSFAGEQQVPADVSAQYQKLRMRCQKPPEMRHACNAARASEDACDCSVSAYYQVQMAAAPKQAFPSLASSKCRLM